MSDVDISIVQISETKLKIIIKSLIAEAINEFYNQISENANKNESLFNVKQVSQQTGYNEKYIYELVKQGVIKCTRIGRGRGSVKFSKDQIQQFKKHQYSKNLLVDTSP